MKKMKVEVVITLVGGHKHTMTGFLGDIRITDMYITHFNVPDSNGRGTYDFVVNMKNVLFYELHEYEVEVDE